MASMLPVEYQRASEGFGETPAVRPTSSPLSRRPHAIGTIMATEQDIDDKRGNAVLNSLSLGARERIFTHLSPVSLNIKTVLFEHDELITDVYFPLSGVISLVTPLKDGSAVEVAMVGNEGIVGVPLQAAGSLTVRAICQVAGTSLRMKAATFLAEFIGETRFRDLVQNYTQALFGQVSQSAACNRLHTNEERLSRWLLMSGDRVGSDEFRITQNFLAQMLGSQRSTVTLSARLLQDAGLIRYHHGRVTIIDRDGLEEVSCECYGVIRTLFDSSAPDQRRRLAARRRKKAPRTGPWTSRDIASHS